MRTLSDLINSDDAVSAVVGYILIFAIVVTMVGLIFIVAMPSIENAQERAYIESIQRGITVFDSKASMVALGESSDQTVNIDSKGGIFKVDENASNITLIMNGTSTPIFSGTLGTMTYELDGTVIAYEGGGVWKQYSTGDPIMLSPPEFHYNYETLTLPIIRLRGNDATSGTGTVQFKVSKDNSQIRYPNSTENLLFSNPVEGARHVLVTIQSDYYKAWAKYLEERTEAQGVTIDPDPLERKVYATLNIKPSDINVNLTVPVTVYGIDENMADPIKEFVFNLEATQIAPGLHPLNYEFKTDEDIDPHLTIEFRWLNQYRVFITYVDGAFIEEWESEQLFGEVTSKEFDMLSDDVMTLTKPTSLPKKTKSWGNDHYGYDAEDFTNGDENSLYNITKHYMSVMPAPFVLESSQTSYNKVDFPNSTLVLRYDVAPPKLTYLHVVKHDVTVDIS